jgi:hypothetical protein
MPEDISPLLDANISSPPKTDGMISSPSRLPRMVMLFLLLIVLLLISGIAYYLGQLSQQKPIPPLPPEASPIVVQNDMSNWKTYSNSEVGFSFQYPSSWNEEKIDDQYINFFGNEEAISIAWGNPLSGANEGYCDADNKFGFIVTPYLSDNLGLTGCILTNGNKPNYILSKDLKGFTILIRTDHTEESITKQILSTFQFVNDDKATIVQMATAVFQTQYPDKEIKISESNLKVSDEWGHGTAGIYTPNSVEGGADLLLYIAHKESEQWRIVMETEEEYKVLFQQLPNTVVSQEVKDFYKNQ